MESSQSPTKQSQQHQQQQQQSQSQSYLPSSTRRRRQRQQRQQRQSFTKGQQQQRHSYYQERVCDHWSCETNSCYLVPSQLQAVAGAAALPLPPRENEEKKGTISLSLLSQPSEEYTIMLQSTLDYKNSMLMVGKSTKTKSTAAAAAAAAAVAATASVGGGGLPQQQQQHPSPLVGGIRSSSSGSKTTTTTTTTPILSSRRRTSSSSIGPLIGTNSRAGSSSSLSFIPPEPTVLKTPLRRESVRQVVVPDSFIIQMVDETDEDNNDEISVMAEEDEDDVDAVVVVEEEAYKLKGQVEEKEKEKEVKEEEEGKVQQQQQKDLKDNNNNHKEKEKETEQPKRRKEEEENHKNEDDEDDEDYPEYSEEELKAPTTTTTTSSSSIPNDAATSSSRWSMRSSMAERTYEVSDHTIIVDSSLGTTGTYEGSLDRITNLPHGHGTMEYQDGTSYTGQWYHGDWSGFGRLSDTISGEYYEGGWFDNMKHGCGVLHYADGKIFDGSFKLNCFDKGTLKFPDSSTFWGNVTDDGIPHGRGKFTFTNGSIYDGEFAMGIISGHGRMTWPDGRWYLGEWSDGEKHGLGMEVKPDGSLLFEGIFNNGVPVECSSFPQSKHSDDGFLLYRASNVICANTLVGPMPQQIYMTRRPKHSHPHHPSSHAHQVAAQQSPYTSTATSSFPPVPRELRNSN